MGDSAAVGSQGVAAAPGIPAVEPATDASCDRRWRRFGEYGKTKRLELLNAAESEQPLPLLEKQRRSALSKREEAALVDFRRHLRGLPSSGDIFRASFVPGYERGSPIGGKGCLGPCDHKFGQEGGTAGEHQVQIAVRMMRFFSTHHSKSYSHVCPRHTRVSCQVWKHFTSANPAAESQHEKDCARCESKAPGKTMKSFFASASVSASASASAESAPAPAPAPPRLSPRPRPQPPLHRSPHPSPLPSSLPSPHPSPPLLTIPRPRPGMHRTRRPRPRPRLHLRRLLRHPHPPLHRHTAALDFGRRN